MSKDTVKLASGQQMPLVGFGLWKVPKETAADTVYDVTFMQTSHRDAYKADCFTRLSSQVIASSMERTTTRTKRKPVQALSARLTKVSSSARRFSLLQSYGTTIIARSTRFL
jgi:hypothetical protein